eukprot:scaffold303243_cov30-Tisochrysis_lutea.AAC.3
MARGDAFVGICRTDAQPIAVSQPSGGATANTSQPPGISNFTALQPSVGSRLTAPGWLRGCTATSSPQGSLAHEHTEAKRSGSRAPSERAAGK